MYKTENEVLLFSYSSGHSELQLRVFYLENHKSIYDQIKFEAVSYLDIPRKFDSLTIDIGDDNLKDQLIREKNLSNTFKNWNLYVLSSKNAISYILAMTCNISKGNN